MDLSWRQEKMIRIIRIILFISSVISAYDVRGVFLPSPPANNCVQATPDSPLCCSCVSCSARLTQSVMPKKYERLIGDYCAREGIAVPPGFARLTASRYVIIRTHLSPRKLIAKTWFKTAD